MKHTYQYDGAELFLRPLEQKDIEPLRRLRNRPENRIWFFGSNEISPEGQQVWFERYLTEENDYMFAVFLPQAPNTFVGAVALYGYEEETDSFEVGRMLLDSANLPRRGMGVELIRCVCTIAERIRENVGLRAEVFENNDRSLRCFFQNNFIISDTLTKEGKAFYLLFKHTDISSRE